MLQTFFSKVSKGTENLLSLNKLLKQIMACVYLFSPVRKFCFSFSARFQPQRQSGRKYRLLVRYFPFSRTIYKYCMGSKSTGSFSRKYVPGRLDACALQVEALGLIRFQKKTTLYVKLETRIMFPYKAPTAAISLSLSFENIARTKLHT